MHSYLIASKNKDKAQELAKKIARENLVHYFDFTILEYETLGIDDVRNFQKKSYLKPFKSPSKIVFIRASDLTHESQNAMLKILEEPPDNTIIIVSVPDKNLILPTILSRCKVLEIKNDKELSDAEISKYQNLLNSINSKGVGERLKLAQDYSKDREQALIYLENLIHAGRDNLLTYPNVDQLNAVKSLQRFYTIIKTTNVNLRLALENLFLNL
jgi:DNA polymerase III delta prime subunit